MTGGSGVVISSMDDYIELGETYNFPVTILDCEMLAIKLALQTVGHCVRRLHTKIHICSDCEVAIKLLSQEYYPKWGSSQQLILEIHQLLRQILYNTSIKEIQIKKVPAHQGIALKELISSQTNIDWQQHGQKQRQISGRRDHPYLISKGKQNHCGKRHTKGTAQNTKNTIHLTSITSEVS